MKKAMTIWVLTNKDADLLGETLEMDSKSSVFDPKLRHSIEQAIWRTKVFDKEMYDNSIRKETSHA